MRRKLNRSITGPTGGTATSGRGRPPINGEETTFNVLQEPPKEDLSDAEDPKWLHEYGGQAQSDQWRLGAIVSPDRLQKSPYAPSTDDVWVHHTTPWAAERIRQEGFKLKHEGNIQPADSIWGAKLTDPETSYGKEAVRFRVNGNVLRPNHPDYRKWKKTREDSKFLHDRGYSAAVTNNYPTERVNWIQVVKPEHIEVLPKEPQLLKSERASTGARSYWLTSGSTLLKSVVAYSDDEAHRLLGFI